MASSATLQTPYAPQILQLPACLLAYFYSAAVVEFYSALDMAPKFFPLWDRAIAKAYRCELGNVGTNGANYSAFFLTAVLQARTLSPTMPEEANLLKRIDEYNYCRHTKGWM